MLVGVLFWAWWTFFHCGSLRRRLRMHRWRVLQDLACAVPLWPIALYVVVADKIERKRWTKTRS
jgi:hypothetical protein